MKYYLITFIILLLIIQPCFGANITNSTLPNISTYTQAAPEEFYGTILYSDGFEIQPNTLIIVTNQSGGVIGRYTTLDAGKYGGKYKPDKRLIVNGFVNDYLYFYVNGIKIIPPQTLKFISGDMAEFNIVIPANQRTSLPIITANITQNTTQVTLKPTQTATPKPSPIATQTINQTIQDANDRRDENMNTAMIGIVVVIIALLIFMIGYVLLNRKIKNNDENNIGDFKQSK
jgi:uncharacterized membrane protein YidH (DUF202 family)